MTVSLTSKTQEKHSFSDPWQNLDAVCGCSDPRIKRVELVPSAFSTIADRVSNADGVIILLEGELTLITEDDEIVLCQGNHVSFKAGTTKSQRLRNRSRTPAIYLEVTSQTTNHPDPYYINWEDLVATYRYAGHSDLMEQKEGAADVCMWPYEDTDDQLGIPI